MKKVFFYLGIIAVAAAAGGTTAWVLGRNMEPGVTYINHEVERTPALGTHFTSYESDCGAHGAPSEEEKSFGLRGGCKDGCGEEKRPG